MLRLLLASVLTIALLVQASAPGSEADIAPSGSAGVSPPDDQAASSPTAADLLFIENFGQFDPSARFVVPGRSGAIQVAEDSLWLTALAPADPNRPAIGSPATQADPSIGRGVHLRLSYPGANPRPRLEGIDRRPVAVSHFLGADPSSWRSRVPVWDGVRYVDLFPGVDLEVTSEGGDLIQRLVARRTDAATVTALDRARLRVEGGADLASTESERVRVDTGIGPLVLDRPRITGLAGAPATGVEPGRPPAVVGQDVAPVWDTAEPAAGLSARSAGDDVVFSTFLGGGLGDSGEAIAIDGRGNLRLAGYTASPDFPVTPGGFQTGYGGSTGFGFGGDAFVAVLDPAGKALLSASFLGGVAGDRGLAVAVDPAGNAYLTGETRSDNFPTTPGTIQPKFGGTDRFGIGSDAFVSKLSPDGSQLLYSTYLGGRGDLPGIAFGESGLAIAVDAAGQATVAGSTNAPNFPTTRSAWQPISPNAALGLGDGFVARIDPSGTQLVYATYLGGEGDDLATALAPLPDGSVLVAGATASADFPVSTEAFQRVLNRGQESGGHDAFVAQLDPAGSAIVASTLLGGGDDDRAWALTVDRAGRPVLAGYAASPDFPTTPGAFRPRGAFDAFAAHLDAGLRTLLFSTYLGGRGEDVARGIAIDGAGNVFLTGQTDSPDFPVSPGASQTGLTGQTDAFLAKLDPTGSDVIYGSFLGGSSVDIGRGLSLGESGLAFLTGNTTSSDYPVSAGALQPTFAGDRLFGDAFVAAFQTPITSGVALQLDAPGTGSASPTGSTTLGISIMNLGRTTAAGPVVLTANLPAGLTYGGTFSEPGPVSTEGDTVVWHLPDLPYRETRGVTITVGLADVPIGTRLPITWTVAGPVGSAPAKTTAVTTILATRPLFFPIAARLGEPIGAGGR